MDKILSDNPAASNVCIRGAIRAMLIANSYKHIRSDNRLFNFGMVDGNVVIIEAGSCCSESIEERSKFNLRVIKQF